MARKNSKGKAQICDESETTESLWNNEGISCNLL